MTLYLDTSSLVKLYTDEPLIEEVQVLVRRADVVATASISYAEVRSTLARLHREKVITAQELSNRKQQFETDWPAFLSITVTDALASNAGGLAERHALTGCNAVQLAAFVQLLQSCDDPDIEFSSFDDRLNKAARSLG